MLERNKNTNGLEFQYPWKVTRNAISVDLHCWKQISSNFDAEVKIIKYKFKWLGYPLAFIDNVIRALNEKNMVEQSNVIDHNDDEPLIPLYFFQVNKCFILLKLPFCKNNGIKSNHFLKKCPSFYKKKSFILQSVGK